VARRSPQPASPHSPPSSRFLEAFFGHGWTRAGNSRKDCAVWGTTDNIVALTLEDTQVRTQEMHMADYKKILLVVDLSDKSDCIGNRAKAIAKSSGAEIKILHVVEYVPLEPMGETLMPAIQIEGELVQRAKTKLTELAARLDLAHCEQLVETGSIKSEIIRVAQEQKVDLIVLGSRERHGVAILVNFTEDTVLHAAPCDVLAVRLPK
jgi:universal stress protein A